jgi:hypothetical protein
MNHSARVARNQPARRFAHLCNTTPETKFWERRGQPKAPAQSHYAEAATVRRPVPKAGFAKGRDR